MRNIIILLTLVFTITSCGTKEIKDLDDYISLQIDKTEITGLAYGILENGELVKTGNFGMADFDKDLAVTNDTLFMIASCSKTLTATAVMQLVENNEIKLDDPISNYLSFPIVNPNFPDKEIKVRHLLTHTSGIEDSWDIIDPLYTNESNGGDSPIDLEYFIHEYITVNGIYYSDSNFSSKNQPGDKHSYCNVGFGILALIVEGASDLSFNQYCRENIFEPLEMNNTTWFLEDTDKSILAMPYDVNKDGIEPIGHYGYPTYPDGQIRTSINEWANFVSIFLNNGSYNGQQVLQEDTVEEMLKIQYPDVDSYQAIAWNYNEMSFLLRNYIGEVPAHSGGDPGVATFTILDPDNDTAVIIFINGMNFSLPNIYRFFNNILKSIVNEAGIRK